MVATGKCDALGEKIENPEAVYYYCGRMGELIRVISCDILFVFKKKYKMVKEITDLHIQF